MNPTVTRTLEEARLKLGKRMRAVGGLIPAVANFPEFWSQQVGQYPPKGPAGISYFKGVVDADIHVDCLLYRDKRGKLIGVLNHYAFDMPPYESKGNINVMVDPEHQGEGIGKLLLKEAMKRWDVNLAQQHWTPSGDRLRQSVQRSDEVEWLVRERGQTEKDAWRIRALNPDDARDVYREQFGSRSDAALIVKRRPPDAPKASEEPLKLGKKMRTIKLKGESLMHPALNNRLEQLRALLEYSPDMGKTPVIPIKVIPVKPRLAKPTRDDEPTEADCKRVGGVLKMVFGRAMCLPASQTAIVGVPAVQRRVREQLEWMRARLEASLSESLMRHAFLYLASDGNWYLELADAEHGSQRDSNAYGPFPSEDAIYSFMDNFSNPGGYWSDDTGKRPPPEKSPNGSPVRKVKKRGSGWDFDYPSTKRKQAPYRF